MTEKRVETARAENWQKYMEDGPRLRYDYNHWVEARRPATGEILIGGLGAMGLGSMWMTEEERHKKLPGYEDAELLEPVHESGLPVRTDDDGNTWLCPTVPLSCWVRADDREEAYGCLGAFIEKAFGAMDWNDEEMSALVEKYRHKVPADWPSSEGNG